VISRQQHPLAFTSFKVWLGGNIVGASIFLWESQEVLLRRQEGDTFVALPLLILIAIYGFIHFLALSAAVVIAVESRSWRVFRGLALSLTLWGAVIGYHFLRSRLSA